MKPADWINLAQLGTSVVGGATSGAANSRAAEQSEFERARQERADEFSRQLQYYTMQQGARSGLGAFYNQTNMDRAAGRTALLDSAPLGAEQEFVAKMARARGLMGVMGDFQPAMPTSADIAGLIRPTGNVLSAFNTPDMQAAYSNMSTARSLAERRKAQAGVDPTFQFGSMGDYGIPNLEKEVATYAQGVAADRLSRENLLQDLLLQQTKAATAFPQTVAQAQGPQGVPPTGSQAAPAKKKTEWWKKVLNVAATAAPLIAAPFTGGTSLALIGAGAGALKGALSGGAKGALTGAAMGAATSAIGGGPAGAGAARGVAGAAKESASAAIKRAILNPRALTQLGGAAVGGQVEQLAQLASPFLPGAKAFAAPPSPGPMGPMGPGAGVRSPLFDPVGPGGQSLPPSGRVTMPVFGMNTPTPTGSDVLGGFGRSNALFNPSMGAMPPPATPMSPAEQQKLLESIFAKGTLGPPKYAAPPASTPSRMTMADLRKQMPPLPPLGQGVRDRSQLNAAIPMPPVNNLTRPATPGSAAGDYQSYLNSMLAGGQRRPAAPPAAPRAPSPFDAFNAQYAAMQQNGGPSMLSTMAEQLTPEQQNYLRGAQALINATPVATAAAVTLPFAAPFAAQLWFGPSGMATPLLNNVISSARGGDAQAVQTLSNIVAQMPTKAAEILSKMSPALRIQLMKSGVLK